MSKPKVLVIGSANIDLVTTAPRCPKPGESLIGRSFATFPGGKGANQAVAAARLGAETYFAGCVGDDAFGEMQRRALTAAGVNVDYLKLDPKKPTGTAVIIVSDEGQNAIVVTPSANLGIAPADVARLGPLFDGLDAVLLQLEIPLETVEAALDMARTRDVLSILDAGPAQAVPEDIVKKAALVSPNETEAEAMTRVAVTSTEDAKAAAAALIKMGAAQVVMKLGALGALYMNSGDSFQVPAFQVSAVDTVAAGDAFTAALGVAWRGLGPRAAIRFANAAGALATTVAGAQPSMPTRAAVDQFLQERDVS